MKTKTFLLLLVVVILFIGFNLLLKIYFKEPDSVIVMIILSGLFFGLLGSIFIGYFNPPTWLFRFRFLINEIGFGIMIGFVLFFSRSIKDQTFVISDLIKFTILASIIAIILGGSRSYIKFKKLVKKTFDPREKDLLLTDSAIYKSSNGEISVGRLLLTNEQLIFYSSKDNECLYDPKLTEIIPTIERSKFLKFPRGLNLLPDETKLYLKFPYHWLKAIEDQKNNAT